MEEIKKEGSINQVQLDAILEGRPDYLSSYRVNLTKDECEYGTSKVPEALIATSGISATELFDIAAERVPDEDERQIYAEYIDRYSLLNAYSGGQKSVSLNHNYHLCGKDMYLTTTINMYRNPLTGDVEGVVYLFDMSHQYLEKKIQSRLIGKQFESIAVIRVSTGKFYLLSQFLYIPESMSRASLDEVDYITHVKDVSSSYIVEEERDIFIYNSSMENLKEQLEKEESYYFTVKTVNEAGERRYKKFTYYYIDEKKDRIISSMEDVTGVIERDSLTGLYNRRGFVRAAGHIIEENKDSGIQYAVMFFNIKNFKAVNDYYGIDGGDMLLRGFTARVRESFLKPVVFARSEADHFVCLVDSENIDYDKLPLLLRGVFTCNNHSVEVQGLCGIYMVKEAGVGINRMCDRAKLAKEHITDIHVKPYALYEPSMRDTYLEKALSVNSIDSAIENKEFKVYYQPVIDIHTEKIVSAEALVRWIHPEYGFIPPDRFIPGLEETGLVSKLDMYVFSETSRFMKERSDNNQFIVPISTNLSWMDFYDTNMLDNLLVNLKQEGGPHGYVRFEVTETSYAGMAEKNHSVLKAFKDAGASILIDDFGSGYSSFSTITEYDFDILKLDMGFVRKIGKNSKIGSVIHSIIDMAHHMDMHVIAEGVETEEQISFLRRHGCDYVQGYYYSKPLPMEDFVKMLNEQQSA